ncbi:MAG: hypothetical protein HKN16_06440 [Saprospiraceae bacterium]|nr:hypothetical protein [Saprospiraceae bacterium]
MNKFFLFCLCILLLGCKRESDLPPLRPDEISAAQREILGLRIQTKVKQNPDFPVRDIQSQQDSILYAYIQWQYDQASRDFHFNIQATPDQQWNPSRVWQIFILELAEPLSLSLPGGDLYISEGMLNLLVGADQLYAMLCLEAARMHTRQNLYKLVEEVGTIAVLEVIERGIFPPEKSLMEILISSEFDPDLLVNIDIQALAQICRSSIFNPAALAESENLLRESQANWINRKSYSGRTQKIIEEIGGGLSGCGLRGDLGDYKKFVLDNL